MIRALGRLLALAAPLAVATPLAAVALAVGCNSGGSGQGAVTDGGSAIADAAGDQSTSDAATAVECIPDGAGGGNCDPCSTLATDPYNVCSVFVGSCIPFDAARVPVHPDL